MIVVSLAIGAACAFGAYRLAEKKGRNPGTWAVVGFLFGLIGLAILACMPSLATDQYAAYVPAGTQTPTKACPYCVARIEASATACGYCGRSVPLAA